MARGGASETKRTSLHLVHAKQNAGDTVHNADGLLGDK